ncbi:MAG: methyltransferase [Marmoricola sp.]
MDHPHERRAAARTAVVWDALQPVLAGLAGDAGEQAVLDIGGGTGGFAVRVAELGHQVTVIDPSPDALAAADRRAHERGVADRITGRQGDLADLGTLAGAGSADLVLCHGVLGIVGDPAAALATIGEVLRPGGRLSLLVGQRHAAVLARAMAGHLGQALELLRHDQPGTDTAGNERRFTTGEITALLDGAGYTVEGVHAVRVFADLVPAALLEAEPGTALVELERAVADRPEYHALAAQLHLLARH